MVAELATGIFELKGVALSTSAGIKTMPLPGHKEVEQMVRGSHSARTQLFEISGEKAGDTL